MERLRQLRGASATEFYEAFQYFGMRVTNRFLEQLAGEPELSQCKNMGFAAILMLHPQADWDEVEKIWRSDPRYHLNMQGFAVGDAMERIQRNYIADDPPFADFPDTGDGFYLSQTIEPLSTSHHPRFCRSLFNAALDGLEEEVMPNHTTKQAHLAQCVGLAGCLLPGDVTHSVSDVRVQIDRAMTGFYIPRGQEGVVEELSRIQARIKALHHFEVVWQHPLSFAATIHSMERNQKIYNVLQTDDEYMRKHGKAVIALVMS